MGLEQLRSRKYKYIQTSVESSSSKVPVLGLAVRFPPAPPSTSTDTEGTHPSPRIDTYIAAAPRRGESQVISSRVPAVAPSKLHLAPICNDTSSAAIISTQPSTTVTRRLCENRLTTPSIPILT